MGFVSKILGFGSPNSEFEATPTQLAQSNYGNAITQAMNNGLTPNQNLVDFGNSNQVRGQQQTLAQAIMQQLQGGPSVAENQLRQATDRNIRQGMGALASQRGVNPAILARQILGGTQAANQQAVADAATLRAQEQQGLYQTLGQMLAQQRSQDLGQSELGVNAGLNTLNANTQRLATAGGLQNQQNATNVENSLGVQKINAGTAANNAQNATGFLSGLLNAGAGIAGKMAGGASQGGEVMGSGGGARNMAMLPMMQGGGEVPGVAKVQGDHPANDTVPAMLSPGEIVVPRSAAKSSTKAKAFIDAVMNGDKDEDEEPSYADVVAVQRHLNKRIMNIEKMWYGGCVK
jgi:hypothetical protein